MYPILYKSNETNFVHNGIGLLRDAITVYPEEELNGYSEITIEYDADGFLSDQIKNGMIIKAKANDKQQPQLFRIYSHVKDLAADQIIINGRHITNDLADNFVEALEIRNVTTYQAMKAIQETLAYPTRFNLSSTNTTTQSSTNIYRNNPLQMVAGTEGSILQHWGGQIERDNFNLIMHRRRGSDDGVKVLYKKNLTGLQAKFDDDSVVTRIYPFKFVEATEEEPERLITVPGKYIDSPYIDKYSHIKILPIDASSEDEIENGTDLYNAYKDYFSNEGRNKDHPSISMEVDFEYLWETEEYKDVAALELVGLGDTVTVGHSKFGLDLKATVVKIEYDSIGEKNRKVSLGNVKANFTDSVNQNANDLGVIGERMNNTEQKSNEAIRAANGKNTIYYGPDEPVGDHLIKGDIWFRIVDGEYTRTYIYDGVQWQLSIDMESKEAKETAAEARNRANDANEKANLATDNANEAIKEAQKGFDKAQESLTESSEARKKAQESFDEVQNAVTKADSAFSKADALSTVVDKNTGDISTVTQIAQGLQTRVGTAEGNISTLQQTAQGFATRIKDSEDNISTLTQTALGLQSTIEGVRSDLDGLEYENRNLIPNNQSFWEQGTINSSNGSHGNNSTRIRMKDFVSVNPNEDYTITVHEDFQVGFYEYTEDEEYIKATVWITAFPRTIKTTNNTNKIKMLVMRRSSETINPSTMSEVFLKNEKGTKATDWSPAPEDMVTKSELTQTAEEFGTKISNAQGEISELRQTSSSLATRIKDAEGDISSVTQTAKGLQTRVGNAEGDISTVTQLASTLQTDLRNAKGDINMLTQTASSLQSTIKGVRDDLDGLEIGEINLVLNSDGQASSTSYRITGYDLSTDWVAGEVWTVVIKGELNNNQRFGIWANGSSTNQGYLTNIGDGFHKLTFTVREPNNSGTNSGSKKLNVYNYPSSGASSANIEWVKLVRGNKTSLSWSPAPEDMATKSQFTQLSDNINLRVQKNDIINQINLSTESILISGKKLILDGDTTVNGSFRVNNAHITSVNAGKITTGTLDAGKLNVINVSANSIVGGVLQSQSSNTTFNLNTGNLTMRNAYFTLGNGARIEFTSVGNRIQYSDVKDGTIRSAGFGVGKSLQDYPFAYSGTTGAANLDTLSQYYSGAMWHTTRAIADGASNSISGYRFQFRNEAVGWNKGITFDFNGSPSIRPINGHEYNYNIGTSSYMFNNLHIRQLYTVGSFNIRNNAVNGIGWRLSTIQESGRVALRGLNGGSYNYDLGSSESYNHFYFGYITNLRGPSGGSTSVGSSSNPYTYGHFKTLTVHNNFWNNSLRAYKENIRDLDLQTAINFVRDNNVKIFNYKDNPQKSVGLIRDDLVGNDSLVATETAISPTNVQYIHQKVTQYLLTENDRLKKQNESLVLKVAELENRLHKLEVA